MDGSKDKEAKALRKGGQIATLAGKTQRPEERRASLVVVVKAKKDQSILRADQRLHHVVHQVKVKNGVKPKGNNNYKKQIFAKGN